MISLLNFYFVTKSKIFRSIRKKHIGNFARYVINRKLSEKYELIQNYNFMVILITGDTHTGKTLLAQRLLEKYKYPYLSIDLLKMGLIRSGQTSLSPESPDSALTDFLWPIVREIIKTCIENGQNMIVEGCYIPFDWEKNFSDDYLPYIDYVCLILSEKYIRRNFENIIRYENIIEKRQSTDVTIDNMIRINNYNLGQCISRKYKYVLIDEYYRIDIDKI